MKIIIELFKKQSGSVLILASVAFTGLLGVTGLVIDGGTIYMNKADLQKAANAAALSGAQELTSDNEQAVRDIVDEVVQRHDEMSTLESVVPIMTEDVKSVKVGLNKTITPSFLKLFGIETLDVKADATATLFAMERAVGAAPLGINENVDLVYGEEYALKVSSGDSSTGDFGILALEGKGANNYEQTFREGYSEELEVGDKVLVQTGNIAGATRDVVGEKVNSNCTAGDRECPRIILILLYLPVCDNPDTCTNYSEVEITGFAYFYITDPMSETDTSITGKFIKRVGTGFGSGNAVEDGAYVAKLTE